MLEDTDTAGPMLHPRAQRAQALIRQLALVALLGVCLGFIMQTLVIIARLMGGGAFPHATLIADVAQGVTWSVLVCTGVAIGISVSKGRHALAGFIGMLFGPLSLAAAKAVQRVMLSVIDAVEQQAAVSLATTSVLRAAEYGLLAWLLARLTEMRTLRPSHYVATGLGVGLSFGLALVWLTYQAQLGGTPLTTAQWIGLMVSEVGTPVGCAFIIYVGQVGAYSARIYGRHLPSRPAVRRSRRAG